MHLNCLKPNLFFFTVIAKVSTGNSTRCWCIGTSTAKRRLYLPSQTKTSHDPLKFLTTTAKHQHHYHRQSRCIQNSTIRISPLQIVCQLPTVKLSHSSTHAHTHTLSLSHTTCTRNRAALRHERYTLEPHLPSPRPEPKNLHRRKKIPNPKPATMHLNRRFQLRNTGAVPDHLPSAPP